MEIEDADEADPIIQEIPVFLSKRFEDQLYLFQYPRQYKLKKAPLNVTSSLIKPNNQVVQLEVKLNNNSKNFSVERAEDIAEEVDGACEQDDKERSPFFKNNMFDSLNLQSSKIVGDAEHYGIGVYNGREYHITPLKGILRFNPYLPHLIKNDKWKQNSKVKENKDEFASPQQVLVKFSSAPKPDSNKVEELTYKKMMNDIAEEAWVKCQWHSESSELSELEKVKLFTEQTRSVTKFDVNEDADKYIRQLIPEDKEETIVQPALPSNVISFNSLRALPLLDRCKLLLKDAKIMAFQQLWMLLAGCDGLTVPSLLKTLPQIAVLVRGNWIVKSEILFPSDTFSAVNGVPADYMCQARDYVLCLFTKNQFVERSKASSVINVPTEELKEILTGISKLRYNKRWGLVLPVDVEFINKYPDIVQRQSLMWEQREVKLNEFFKERGNKDKRQRRKSKSVSEDSNKAKDNLNADTDIKVEKNKSPVAARRARNLKVTQANSTMLNNKMDTSRL